MGATTIQWTDRTWNPVRGCSRVSPGCVNCYAERQAARFCQPGEFVPDSEFGGEVCEPAGPFHGFVTKVNGHAAWTGKVELIESKLEEPLRWRKPCRVFVNSMSDLFHKKLALIEIKSVFDVMEKAHWHTFQILTKRAAAMAQVCQWLKEQYDDKYPLPNVWLGVSVEDQQRADERIPLLLRTPAAVRFVSYEPALGPVDFSHYLEPYWTPQRGADPPPWLDWIIVGAESGPGARPFSEDWARSTRDQCQSAGVAFFYKQDAVNGHKIGTPKLDGRQWMQFPGEAA